MYGSVDRNDCRWPIIERLLLESGQILFAIKTIFDILTIVAIMAIITIKTKDAKAKV